ncbi:hypothetical protein F7725_002841 [Dissostichus mawsoni]|uniref:Uncharacterized protein n=1 Tax=Dissostichus mawsoni TaxID=36200 RepID=A0A7J5Y9C7_DISMA|nr:hypothetical protein F7725_002841 [Dissostichus mawsoni]
MTQGGRGRDTDVNTEYASSPVGSVTVERTGRDYPEQPPLGRVVVKRSFGLCSLQLTYFDEENEELTMRALKSAARQGNRLHMNVYETGASRRGSPPPRPAARSQRGASDPPALPRSDPGGQPQSTGCGAGAGHDDPERSEGNQRRRQDPPAWFTLYMEKFKDQVVREAVEKICREFSGQCCIHKPLGGGAGGGGGRGEAAGGAEAQQVPEVSSSTLPGAPSSSTPPCSSCRGQTTGGGYHVCTSCTLCEPCSFAHDPSHNLVRARTPLSIPEHGSPAPDHSR